MLGQATSYVSGQLKKIDEQTGLSKIASTAVSETNDLVSAVSNNSYVSSTFSMFRGWGSSIAKAYNAIYNESAAAIEARQKENEEQLNNNSDKDDANNNSDDDNDNDDDNSDNDDSEREADDEEEEEED